MNYVQLIIDGYLDPSAADYACLRDAYIEGNLLRDLVSSKLLPEFASLMARPECPVIPGPQGTFLRRILDDNTRSNNSLISCAGRIVALLRENNIPVRRRKGLVTVEEYGGVGHRYLSDMDLFVRRRDYSLIRDAYAAAGFKVGTHYGQHGEMQIPRRDIIIYSLSPDHLPTHTVVEGSYVFEVDSCSSLTWASAELDIVTDDVQGLFDKDEVDPFVCLDIALHIFRESTLERFKQRNQHKSAHGLLDLALLFRRYKSLRSEVEHLASELNCTDMLDAVLSGDCLHESLKSIVNYY